MNQYFFSVTYYTSAALGITSYWGIGYFDISETLDPKRGLDKQIHDALPHLDANIITVVAFNRV